MATTENVPVTFEHIWKLLRDAEGHLSLEEITKSIKLLEEAKRRTEETERRKKKEQERQAREKAEQEAKQRHDEHVAEVTSMELPMDWENLFSSDHRAQNVHADSIPDGLILSLKNLGKVDIEYIAAITGAQYKDVIHALKGSIYQNPETWNECFYKGWETSDEYLSGNLLRKRQVAMKANQEFNGHFSSNIAAIDRVLPPAVATEEIYITLGSPWVPPDVIDDFIIYLFGAKSECVNLYQLDPALWRTMYDEMTGSWEIPYKSRYGNSIRHTSTYGTSRVRGLYLLEKTLNMKPIAVMNEVYATNASGARRVLDEAETAAVLEKQRKMIQAFQDWVWRDPVRKERLETIFESKFTCVRRRTFDGSFLEFPGMSPDITLYPHQKNAVARIIFSPNTLLAHEVGSGKTYSMIAAGMEMLRMGLSEKNLYVVPNGLVGQWEAMFHRLYPQADLLCVEPKKFRPEKRSGVLQRIRDERFDGIIMAYSCFEQIPLSKAYYLEALEERKNTIAAAVKRQDKATSRLRRKKEAVDKALSELAVTIEDLYDDLYFDELGITRLFVDEAHNFKNVPIDTQMGKTLGISAGGSKKCRDMMDKVRLIQKQNNGGGVVFATGTPITNSITDAYIMQQYLQSGELAMLDLQSFDSWVGMFAEKVTDFEVDVDTSNYRMATRFSRFHNLPELTSLLSSIADFHRVEPSDGIPETDGRRDVRIGKTPEFEDFLQEISNRVDMIRSCLVNRREDNMLKVTSDGRNAALDLRLVNPAVGFTYQSKVAYCAETVASIYQRTDRTKSTQLIFCDSSTPKAGFNIYDELRLRLTSLGVPDEKIAYIHDADTMAKRKHLFDQMRNGEIRILIGSTFKLGIGVNVQDRLIALHHLDVPWRPSDLTQREGRILRRGNQNRKVLIYRYITEGSFDAYSWQILETKQRFIDGLLAGSVPARSGDEIENMALDYAEVKALAVGDSRIKDRVETANKLERLMTLHRKWIENRLQLKQELEKMPGMQEEQRLRIAWCQADLENQNVWKRDHPPVGSGPDKKKVAEWKRSLQERLREGLEKHIEMPEDRTIFTYRGMNVVLPANMTPERLVVRLDGAGKYFVEMGDSDTGRFLLRIDHCLDSFPDRMRKLRQRLADLEKRESDIRTELAQEEDYTKQISFCRERLARLDKELEDKRV